jgi:hypothetical protein
VRHQREWSAHFLSSKLMLVCSFSLFTRSICPSIVDTTMWEHMDAELAKIEDISVGEAKVLRVKLDIILGRILPSE